MRSIVCVVAIAMSLSQFCGCRQNGSVINPLSVFTPKHVPAPATGSFNVPDRYYQSQTPAPGGPVSQSSFESRSASLSGPDAPIGSGVPSSSIASAPSTSPIAQASYNQPTGGGLPVNDYTTGNTTVLTAGRQAPPAPPSSINGFRGVTSHVSSESVGNPIPTIPSASMTDSAPQQQPPASLNWRSPGSSP